MGWFPFLETLAVKADLPTDILKITFALFTVIALSPLLRIITSRSIRNLLNLFIGTSFLFFMLEQVGFFVLGGMIVPYFLMVNLPNPFLISVICSIFELLAANTYRTLISYGEWRADCSVYVMILVTKLTYWAKWFQELQQKQKTSFVDFMSYNLFFPGLLAGPTFSFTLFLEYLERPQHKPSLPFFPLKALQPILVIVPVTFITLNYMPIFTQTWVTESPFYLGLPLWQKILILTPIGFIYRTKYYSAWYIGQLCCNLSGISQSQSGQYDKVKAINILFELQPNPKKKTQYWNTSFQEWIKQVVYTALSKKMNPQLALFVTFLISAFWHGLYLIYYVIFFLWAILIHLSKWSYKWSLTFPPKIAQSKVVTVLTWIVSFSVFSAIGMTGAVLNWELSLQFLADLYYFPVIVLGIFLPLSLILKPPRVKKGKNEKEE